MDCRKQHLAGKCKHGPSCDDFYCTERHPRSRSQPCRNVKETGRCGRSDCRFLHPHQHRPQHARPPSSSQSRLTHVPFAHVHPAGLRSSDITTVKLTNFSPSVAVPADVRHQLQCILSDHARHPVFVNTTAEAMAVFDTSKAASAAVAHFNGRAVPGLGTLCAKLFCPTPCYTLAAAPAAHIGHPNPRVQTAKQAPAASQVNPESLCEAHSCSYQHCTNKLAMD